MSYRAQVTDRFEFDGVQIQLGEKRGEYFAYLAFERASEVTLQPGEMVPRDSGIDLPIDAARALYESLAQYFGNSTDNPTALRQDYLAERKRVDTMLESVLQIAKGGAK